MATNSKRSRRTVKPMGPVMVGITSSPGARDGVWIEGATRSYVDAVSRAGGLPVVLPVLTPSAVDGVLERLDGLLLSGGGDIDPALYGAEPDPHLAGVDAERDAYELALVRRAVERGIPVLGVCRGAQVINVARGGSLIQHLDDHTGFQHQERLRYDSVIHHVSIVPGSRVADVVGSTYIGVNTLHHQAVERLGDGLTAVAWSTDEPFDLIEAIELAGRDVLGVQWHPELLPTAPEHQALFTWLVDTARQRSQPLPAAVLRPPRRRSPRRAVA
jgi:putative glutamine amidotransferase